jgi:hypothetical protein
MKETQKVAVPKAFELVERILALYREDPSSVEFGEQPGRAIAIAHVHVPDEGEIPVLLSLEATPLLSQDQAAELMKISTRTLQKWAAAGLPSIPYRVGARTYPKYPLNLLEEYARSVGHKPGTVRVGAFGRRLKGGKDE